MCMTEVYWGPIYNETLLENTQRLKGVNSFRKNSTIDARQVLNTTPQDYLGFEIFENFLS